MKRNLEILDLFLTSQSTLFTNFPVGLPSDKDLVLFSPCMPLTNFRSASISELWDAVFNTKSSIVASCPWILVYMSSTVLTSFCTPSIKVFIVCSWRWTISRRRSESSDRLRTFPTLNTTKSIDIKHNNERSIIILRTLVMLKSVHREITFLCDRLECVMQR